MIVLGIETSCDETAAAVVVDGTRIMSSVVASQIKIHHPYGGVVPELASRKHMEAIVPVVVQALDQAKTPLSNIEGVAATQGPGLVGSLLVGFCFAKSLAFAGRIPWVGVNHLEAHVNSVFLEPDPPVFPFVALLASGGHTAVYRVASHRKIELLGQTRDDAAGEAFDKVAKMLGFGYPGGGIIGRLAQKGDPKKIHFPRTYLDKSAFDFSFSGLKTAVKRHLEKNSNNSEKDAAHIAASFQEAVVDVLSYKIVRAAEKTGCAHLAVVGGVAANRRLREQVTARADRRGLAVHIPAVDLCGDNAAMVAATGFHYLKSGAVSQLDDDVYSKVQYV